MIDDGERYWDGMLLGGGVLQLLVVLGLFFLDRPSLAPAGIDLGWHTVALVQAGLLLGAIIWGSALQGEVRSIRIRLADLEASGQHSGGVADE